MLNDTSRPDPILDIAIQAAAERTGLSLAAIATGPDADLLIKLENAAADTQYRVEIRRYLNKQTVSLLAVSSAQDDSPTILVADYVNPQQANRLRQLNFPFIDTAGNAYINEPPIYVFATGNKPEVLPTARPRVRLFQPTGLKLIFALLNQPGLVQRPYREQADIADIALGAVAWIMNDLRDSGYVVEAAPKARLLINKQALLTLWVENYPDRLRKKLILGRYKTARPQWWDGTDIAEHDAYWGGEIAADRLIRYLKPEDATIYADKVPARLLLNNRLEKASDGNIEIIKRFWNFDYPQKALQTVPPILIYADLIATGIDRNTEVARLVYDEYVAQHIRED